MPSLRIVAQPADIEIEWLNAWASSGRDLLALGTTDVHYVGSESTGYTIDHAKVVLNGEDFVWSTEGASGEGVGDVRTTLVHELGHALGLLHVCEAGGSDGAPICAEHGELRSSVMYPEYQGASLLGPSADDYAGLCFLATATACGDDCDSAGPTPALPEELEPGDPCEAPEQCASGLCSADGYCSAACGDGLGCPPGFSCDEAGLGSCVAALGVLGDGCATPEDCASGLCLASGDSGQCVRVCSSERGCPAGYACRAQGERTVCMSNGFDAAHCAVRPRGNPSTGLAALLGALLAVLLRRRAERTT